MKCGIVIVGYNRIESIKRLLKSLEKNNYGEDKVDIIISIDNSGNDIIENYAKEYIWKFGEKKIKTYKEKLGLRNHILKCGDYVNDYDAIAVFEDDIYVSANFYNFMKQSVEFYKDENEVAGISLYSHFWNEYRQQPFTPEKNKYDIYLMQYAQSWGQIWLKKQWFEFKAWYEKNETLDFELYNNLPNHIKDWPETSWLKYHIAYCILKNKYFVYPYISLTTNFTELGQHCKIKTPVYQVPIIYDDSYIEYKFGLENRENSVIRYDGYFERIGLEKYLTEYIKDETVTVDLYGGKNSEVYGRYLISREILNYKVKKSFALELRPHERNIIENIEGEGIYIYDTQSIEEKYGENNQELNRWYYDSRVFDYKYIIKVILKLFMRKVKEKINIIK